MGETKVLRAVVASNKEKVSELISQGAGTVH